jgi:hypothetical protein
MRFSLRVAFGFPRDRFLNCILSYSNAKATANRMKTLKNTDCKVTRPSRIHELREKWLAIISGNLIA